MVNLVIDGIQIQREISKVNGCWLLPDQHPCILSPFGFILTIFGSTACELHISLIFACQQKMKAKFRFSLICFLGFFFWFFFGFVFFALNMMHTCCICMHACISNMSADGSMIKNCTLWLHQCK